MCIGDIAAVLFACVAANHIGPIPDIERIIRHRIPVIGCPKCLSFWSVLAYCMWQHTPFIESVAVSFLCAWLAIWLELFMAYIDTIYIKIYDTIYPTAHPTDADTQHPDNPLPGVRE